MVLLSMLAFGGVDFEGMKGKISTRFLEERQDEIEPFSRLP